MNEFLAAEHAFIVHFALALSVVSSALALLHALARKEYLEHASFVVMIAALPFLLAAVFTGNIASQLLLLTEKRELVGQHETLASLGVWLFFGASVWKIYFSLQKKFIGIYRWIFLVAILFASIVIVLAARKGALIGHSAARSFRDSSFRTLTVSPFVRSDRSTEFSPS